MIKPVIEKNHPIGIGIQKIYRFKNGYGASVVRFQVDGIYGSHTNENDWELGVIKFNSDDDMDFKLVYDTSITSNVLGYLSDEEVQETLKKVRSLK